MIDSKHKQNPIRAILIVFVVFLGSAVLLFVTGCQPVSTTVSEPTQTLLPTPVEEPLATVTIQELYPSPGEGYPVVPTPSPDLSPAAYPPVQSTTPSGEALVTEEPPADQAAVSDNVFIPVIGLELPPESIPSPTTEATEAALSAAPETPVATLTPASIVAADFEAARAELESQGRDLVYNKIGFHVTFLEDRAELDNYMVQLDSHGVPFFLKSVDNAEPLYKAQELMKASGVQHTLVYRSTAFDVPNYDLSPEEAAEMEWEAEKALWPAELDPSLIWLETVNEPDKNRAEWLARFSLRKAQLALQDGYRWAAFSWASGEPEPSDWEIPAMLDLLRLIGENPDRLAIALHEYSYLADNIGHEYPYKIGRFLDLFRIADENGIPRPTVLITEWGWTYNDLPPLAEAMQDIDWAARLYGAYPEVRGAAIWNLGQIDGELLNLNEQVQELIDPLTAYSLTTYFSAPRPPEQSTLDPGQFPPP